MTVNNEPEIMKSCMILVVILHVLTGMGIYLET